MLGLGLGLGRAARAGAAGIAAPVNTVAPVISGTPYVGQTLSVSNGTWTGGVDSYAYQWRDDGAPISGAVANTFLLTASELGGVITCTVTATNAGGSTAATSAGTAAVSDPKILDGTSPSGAWSMSRDLLTSFIGSSRYTDVSGAVSSLKDQSGNARNLDQATSIMRPSVVSAGANSRTAADFDGTGDNLAGAAASAFIAAGAGYMIVTFIADVIVQNLGGGGGVYLNDSVVHVGGGYAGLYLGNTGSPATVYAYNYDGSADVASSASITLNQRCVAEWKHESGNVSLRVNGGAWIDQASGNTSLLTGALGLSSGGQAFNGKIFEFATWSSVPSGAVRDAVAADFAAWAG